MTNSEREGASFRDPSGFLFRSAGVLLRQINKCYHEDYEYLVNSGLYQKLVNSNLLIPHEESSQAPFDPSISYKVIKPESLTFVSYPYEWSFSQLKDAALTTLKIQKLAFEYGMVLKDASGYNIQFHLGHPVLIDTLSFERYKEKEPWVAYRQFCQHFMAPLALMICKDIRLAQLLRVYIDGIPLDLASRLLPWRTHLSFSLLSHIHLHAAAQHKYAGKAVSKSDIKHGMSKNALFGLIDSLETGIRKLHWKRTETEWAEYSSFHNYSSQAREDKERFVSEFLDQIQPANVWDLGANTGHFSRIASERNIPTIAFDVDPGAVELNYLESVSKKEKYILPLLMNLTNPSSSLGWANAERLSLIERGPVDAIMALALVHHLSISNNVPFKDLASFLGKLCRWLVIEFVPKSDPQVQRLLASREDIFDGYTLSHFETIFSEVFTIRRTEVLRGSQRRLFLMEKC